MIRMRLYTTECNKLRNYGIYSRSFSVLTLGTLPIYKTSVCPTKNLIHLIRANIDVHGRYSMVWE
jgi:hypothetical protein